MYVFLCKQSMLSILWYRRSEAVYCGVDTGRTGSTLEAWLLECTFWTEQILHIMQWILYKLYCIYYTCWYRCRMRIWVVHVICLSVNLGRTQSTMPVHKAEALFDFKPTADVELQLKVLCARTRPGMGIRALDRQGWCVYMFLIHSLREDW